MANRKVTINISTTANTSGADQAAASMDRLAVSSNKATTATAATGKGASKVGQLAGQAGFQIQDFAVQVGAGTSALTAFSQQAPQLLGAFGPAGAIAGAVVAIGAIAAKVFLSMGDDALSTEEKAKKLAEAFEKIGEEAEKAVRDEIDFGRQKIEDTTTAAENLADELNNVAENQLKLDKVILDSMTKINEAESVLQDLRGESADKLKLQAEQLAQEAETRNVERAMEIQAEENRLKVANDAKAVAEANLELVKQQRQEAIQKLEADEASLKAKRDEFKALQDASKQTVGLAFALSEGGLPNASTPAAMDAQSKIDTNVIQKEIQDLKVTVQNTVKALESNGELADGIRSAEQAVVTANTATNKALSDFNFAVEGISIENTAEEISAATTGLKEKSELMADEVEKMIDGVKATNATEQQALETLKTALVDDGIALDEVDKTGQALAVLGPLIRASIDKNTQSVDSMIRIMNDFKSKAANQQQQIDRIQQQNRTPAPAR
jgi:hypothetical protein